MGIQMYLYVYRHIDSKKMMIYQEVTEIVIAWYVEGNEREEKI